MVSIEDFYTYAAKPRYGQDHENPRVKWLGHRSILVNVISQLMGVITMAVMNVPPTASRVAIFFWGGLPVVSRRMIIWNQLTLPSFTTLVPSYLRFVGVVAEVVSQLIAGRMVGEAWNVDQNG